MKQPVTPPPVTASKVLPWHPVVAISLVVLVYFVGQFISGLLVSIYPALHHWSHARTDSWFTNAVTAQFWYTLVFEVMMAAAIYLFVRHYKQSLAAIGLKRPKWADLGFGALGFAGYFIVYVVLIGVLSQLIPAINAHSDQDVGFNNVHGALPLILAFFSLVVFPPLVEELAFRGLIFGSLRKNLNFYWAAVITSLLFALPHLFESGNGGLLYIGGIDTLTLSLVACYMREKTDRLWPGMVLHALKNLLAFYSLYILGGK